MFDVDDLIDDNRQENVTCCKNKKEFFLYIPISGESNKNKLLRLILIGKVSSVFDIWNK